VSQSTKRAQRARAKARYDKYLQRRERKRRRQQLWRRIAIGAVIATLLIGMGYVGVRALVSSGSDAGQPVAAPTPVPPVAPGCQEAVVAPVASPPQFNEPGKALKAGKPASLSLQTNCGIIDIRLDTSAAPKNSNSLAFLTNKAWYDASSCHRLTTQGIYVLQCGDPTGTGTGGPGFTTADENVPKDGVYPAGTVAMAEPQGGQAGSQFFIVYRDTKLPAQFTVVGQVTGGLDVVRRVAAAGVKGGGSDGPPAQPLVIKRATVKQK
jgi:peptidyl-prolyl cis-trans isomerase B (cyclophilin B)